MNKQKVIAALNSVSIWSLYILAFFLPFSKSIIEIAIVTTILSWGGRKILIGDLALKKTPLNWALLVFFAANVISLLNAGNLTPLVLKALVSKCLKYIVFYFAVIETIDSREKLTNIVKITVSSVILVVLDGFMQYYVFHYDPIRNYQSFKYASRYAALTTGVDYSLGFPTGPFPFPNSLSAWLITTTLPMLCVFMWGMKGSARRYLLGLFSASAVFLLYLSNTRSAWLSFFAAFFIALIMKKKTLVIFFVIVIMVVTLPFLPKEKVGNILGFTSMQDRFFMWDTGWKIFMEHPIVGNGLNTFFVKYMEFRGDQYRGLKGSYAHNGYLQIAADTGLIGLGAFLFLLVKFFWSTIRSIKICKDEFYGTLFLGMFAGITAFLIQSFFDVNLQSLQLVVLFWFFLSVTVSLREINS